VRIVHLLASPVFSGPAENVALLARAQRSLGHEVTVAIDRRRSGTGSEEPAAPRFASEGLLCDAGLELSTKSPPWRTALDVLRLRALEADVVHAHFSHDHLLARLAGRKRVVRSIHAPRSLRWSTPRANAFTLPPGLNRALEVPWVELPALVDETFRPDREAARRELGLSGEPLVGMVSTFQPSRRHSVALAAFAELRKSRPSARLVLVGDGVLEAELRAEVAARGLADAVRFAGYQTGDRFVRHLQALDEVWVLGLGNDFSARPAAQARACGVRVIAVAEGALPNLADAVVAPEAAAVCRASLEGTRRVVDLVSAEAIARSVLDLYARVA
jgi:hypothetical protein